MRSKIITYGVIAIVAVVGLLLAWRFVFNSGSGGTGQGNGQAGTLPQAGTQTGTGGSGGAAGGNVVGGSGTVPSGGGAAGIAGGNATKFGVVSNEPVLAYFVDAQNNTTIVEPDGRIARIVNGEPTFLSSPEIENLISASFSHNGQRVFANFGNAANPQTSIFDIAVKAWMPLTAGIVSPVWSPSDNRIAYLKNSADGSVSLVTLDVSKAANKPVVLFEMHAQDLTLAWPNKNQILLRDRPSSYAQGSAWFFDLQKKTLTAATAEAFGLETIWSNTTSSAGLIFSVKAGYREGQLSLLIPPATSTRDLDLAFLTLPSKCSFNYEAPAAATSTKAATSTPAALKPYLALYCAVPQDAGQLSNARLPDDYEQMTFFTADSFYKIRTDTGAVEPTLVPAGSFDAAKLRVINHILFFVNRYDQKLYAISL